MEYGYFGIIWKACALSEQSKTIDQDQIVIGLMSFQALRQIRIGVLVQELDDVLDTARISLIGNVVSTLDRAKAANRAVSDMEGLWRLSRKLRKDKRYRQTITKVRKILIIASLRKIQKMQARMYRENLDNTKRVWNKMLVNGARLTVTPTKAELRKIHQMPMAGMEVAELLDSIGDDFEQSARRAASAYVVSETGDLDGKRMLIKRLRLVVDDAERNLKQVANEALMVANAAACEWESKVFQEVAI